MKEWGKRKNPKMKSRYRLLFALLGSAGMAIIYGFKVNLSVAIVAMVNHTAIKESSEIFVENVNQSANEDKTMLCKSESSDTIDQKVSNYHLDRLV